MDSGFILHISICRILCIISNTKFCYYPIFSGIMSSRHVFIIGVSNSLTTHAWDDYGHGFLLCHSNEFAGFLPNRRLNDNIS